MKTKYVYKISTGLNISFVKKEGGTISKLLSISKYPGSSLNDKTTEIWYRACVKRNEMLIKEGFDPIPIEDWMWKPEENKSSPEKDEELKETKEIMIPEIRLTNTIGELKRGPLVKNAEHFNPRIKLFYGGIYIVNFPFIHNTKNLFTDEKERPCIICQKEMSKIQKQLLVAPLSTSEQFGDSHSMKLRPNDTISSGIQRVGYIEFDMMRAVHLARFKSEMIGFVNPTIVEAAVMQLTSNRQLYKSEYNIPKHSITLNKDIVFTLIVEGYEMLSTVMNELNKYDEFYKVYDESSDFGVFHRLEFSSIDDESILDDLIKSIPYKQMGYFYDREEGKNHTVYSLVKQSRW